MNHPQACGQHEYVAWNDDEQDHSLDDTQDERPVRRVVAVELEDDAQTCACAERDDCDKDVQQLQIEIVAIHMTGLVPRWVEPSANHSRRLHSYVTMPAHRIHRLTLR